MSDSIAWSITEQLKPVTEAIEKLRAIKSAKLELDTNEHFIALLHDALLLLAFEVEHIQEEQEEQEDTPT